MIRAIFFGAGAVGSFFSALLSRVCDVVLVGRHAHVKAIRAKGLEVVFGTEGNRTEGFLPEAVEKLEEIVEIDKTKRQKNKAHYEYEFIFITCKSYDTLTAAGEIEKYLYKTGDAKTPCESSSCLSFPKTARIIISLQNGLGNLETLRDAAGIRAWAASTTYGISFEEPGKVRLNGSGEVFIGIPETTDLPEVLLPLEKIISLFKKAGVNIFSLGSEEIREYLWKKAVINSAINPLTALSRLKNRYVLENKYLSDLSRVIAQENLRIAHKKGMLRKYTEAQAEDWVRAVVKATGENTSSMLQDVLAGRKTEIDSINGYFLSCADDPVRECPVNYTITMLVRSLSQHVN
ncbi:MAG: 2-dehydropantoate 2-reductase [Thermoplasmata archaeon]